MAPVGLMRFLILVISTIIEFNSLRIFNIIRLNLLHKRWVLLNGLNLCVVLLLDGVNLSCGIRTWAKNKREVQQNAQN